LGRQACLVLAGAAAAVGVLLLTGGVIAYRMGWLDIGVARDGARALAQQAFAAGGVFALAGGLWSFAARSSRGVILAIGAVIACGTGGGWLYGQSLLARALPPISDMQTDWNSPIAFSDATLSARTDAGAPTTEEGLRVPPGNGAWSGMTYAEAQASAFPLAALQVNTSPAEVISAAETAAKRLGWRVTLSDPAGGRLEAVATSRWYGLKMDLAVRAKPSGGGPSGGGTRVDVRAASRTPGGDAGALARRVEVMVNDIAFALRGA
jgi:hypothetical protein